MPNKVTAVIPALICFISGFSQQEKIFTSPEKTSITASLPTYHEKGDTYKKGQVILIVSPPGIFSYPTYKYSLGSSKDFNGRIPLSLMNYNAACQLFVNNRLAMGINYKHSHFRITNSYLLNKNSNNYEKTNLKGSIHNVLLYGRFYYLIRPRKDFDNNIIFYSGAGIGTGRVNWQSETGGNYNFYKVPNCEGLLYQIDLLGIDKVISKHFVLSFGMGFGSNGFASIAIQYKIYSNQFY